MDDVLETIKPAPDSHFRLLPCECTGDNVAYEKYKAPDGERWRVRCFDCGKITDPGRPTPRHEVQVLWNRRIYAK